VHTSGKTSFIPSEDKIHGDPNWFAFIAFLGLLGFCRQLVAGFEIPFPFNVVLFPFVVTEKILWAAVVLIK